jgi:hypothetical protein
MDKVEPKVEPGPWDFSTVIIDKQTVQGRPVEWDKEMVDGEGHTADKTYAKPIKFETVCPYCGQLIFFTDKHAKIKCTECKKGEDVLKIPEVPPANPFQDPMYMSSLLNLRLRLSKLNAPNVG